VLPTHHRKRRDLTRFRFDSTLRSEGDQSRDDDSQSERGYELDHGINPHNKTMNSQIVSKGVMAL
jgi:hypothetical protein